MNGSIIIPIAVLVIIFASVTTIVASYFKLQRHRADAAALAEYRGLAERVTAQQETMSAQLAELGDRVKAVEKLLQSVG
ncbi:hypothetical protein CP981_20730 [Streptomyces platensis]|uniref:Uncharacterized protein n=1 Tax=Streptomyces platensis TaxID=58346 RepID=A0AAE6NLR1_STRPT|nr:hypothetical protein [Streptomyces platensis]OSY36688.1 hypothetical protein BG653_06728 [Streptomyces platensis]QEV53751.1 hypothetical protein CP981_20730 [Streptomyces platensis]WSW53469.1 GIL1 family protein [Streptomyces platensis]BCK69744.1 hypothetical protein Srufu_036970 [Streptomyces libani subsp. rufus]